MKINEGKPNQIAWSFNAAMKFLETYINQDITKDEIWERIVADSNEIAEKSKNDCLTMNLLLAVCDYLEELYKIKARMSIQKEIKGFKVGE